MFARRSIVAIVFTLLPLLVKPVMAKPATVAEAYDQLGKGKYVDVLEFALEALRQDPDSYQALFLLGAALHRGEGNLPLAQRRLEQARNIVVKKGGYSTLSSDDQKFYVDTISELIWICGESEQFPEELHLIDVAKSELDRDWSYRSGWALMKMGRLDEARRLMEYYAQNSNASVRATAMNTLGAIESATGNFEAGYDWFTKIIADEEAKKSFGGATLYHNRAETAISMLWFGRAEADLLEGTRHFSTGTYSNPWSSLTFLYTTEGKLPLAVDAARQMRDWNRAQDVETEQFRWSSDTRTLANLLMALGRDRAALATLQKVLRRPDRQGASSTSSVEAEICLLAAYDEALRVNRERALEGLSWRRPSGWFGRLHEVVAFTVEDWTTRSRLRALVMKNDKLTWILRPYSPDSSIPEWMRTSVIAALGEGMAMTKMRELMQSAPERERPYIREELGETEVRNRHYHAGAMLLESALHDLPQEEALLRARAHALLAEAQERTGQIGAARVNYVKALELDARVFRALALSIPVSIRTDGDKASQMTASWLKSSPRFRRGSALIVEVRRTSNGIEALLEDPSGSVLGRAAAKDAALLTEDVHEKFFAPRINLEQRDLNSLDGTNTSSVAMSAIPLPDGRGSAGHVSEPRA